MVLVVQGCKCSSYRDAPLWGTCLRTLQKSKKVICLVSLDSNLRRLCWKRECFLCVMLCSLTLLKVQAMGGVSSGLKIGWSDSPWGEIKLSIGETDCNTQGPGKMVWIRRSLCYVSLWRRWFNYDFSGQPTTYVLNSTLLNHPCFYSSFTVV